jgi:hypothetical protein
MGASQSAIDASQNTETRPDLSPRPIHLLRLYTKEFEREDESNEDLELYLHNYGDDDTDESMTEVGLPDEVTTPAQVSPDEDDYPIETVNAHIDRTMDRLEQSKPSGTRTDQGAVEYSLSQIFEQSRASAQEDLDARFTNLPREDATRCTAEKAALMQCHKEKEDVLQCRDLVDRYFQCARSASEELLRNRN